METLFFWLTVLGIPMFYAGIVVYGLEFAGKKAGLPDQQRQSLQSIYGFLVAFPALIAAIGMAATHDPHIEVILPAVNGEIARWHELPWTWSMGFAQLGWGFLGGGITTACVAVVAAVNIWIAKRANRPTSFSEWRE
jgi:hypothetical protein